MCWCLSIIAFMGIELGQWNDSCGLDDQL